MRRRAFFAGFAALWISLSGAKPASAKTKVEILAVEWDDKTASKAMQSRVRRLVRNKASATLKHLSFGKQGKAQLTLEIRELTISEEPDLLRVSCSIVGRLKGGGTARSKLSFGGKPDRKKKLLTQVLGAVTEGVMTRLAQLSRDRQALPNGA